MDHSPSLQQYLLFGNLKRNYLISPSQKALIDIPGGSLLFSAIGLKLWHPNAGLISRVGEDYPQEWLEKLKSFGFDTRGIHILPRTIDLRSFVAYTDLETRTFDSPISHFANLGLQLPKDLLGYTVPVPQIDSRTQPNDLTLRASDIPTDFLDATAAHLGPTDYLTHSLLPSVLHRGNISTITLDPGSGYMNPTFWDNLPVLVKGITAFLCNEEKLNSLFQGRTKDPWEMAETIASWGAEIVVIKRGGRGQFVYEQATRGRWMVPAYPARITNPTGCGDAYNGGFLVGYRDTYNPVEAALCGTISASFVIEGDSPFYALDALPGLAKARLENLRESVRRI